MKEVVEYVLGNLRIKTDGTTTTIYDQANSDFLVEVSGMEYDVLLVNFVENRKAFLVYENGPRNVLSWEPLN